ncbi:MAG: DUF4836 family protein [Microscillaceae bacterium]|jgi:hypothetical protein|nr:DUF4836 family protein [Microscillaceae bacterium]
MKNKPYFQFFIKFRSLLYALLVLGLVSNCGGGSKISDKHVQIPADASFVASINLKSLNQKAGNWRDIWDKDFLKSFDVQERDFDKFAYELLHSGLDLEQKAYLFGKVETDKANNYYALSFLLKNPSDFEKALTGSEAKPAIKTAGELKYAVFKKDLVFWKNNSGLVIGYEDAENISENKLLAQAQKLFALKTAESLTAKNQVFRDLEITNKDFTMWFNIAQLSRLSGEIEGFRSFNSATNDLVNMLEYGTFSLNFENGQIIGESITHLNKDLSKKYKDLLRDGINEKVVKGVPIPAPSLVGGFGLGMKGLYQMMKDDESIKNYESIANNMGLSTQEYFELFSGDFIVAVRNLDISNFLSNPNPEYVLALGIANKKNLGKLIKNIEKEAGGMLAEKGGHYVIQAGDYQIFLIEKNDALYITSTESFKNDLISGKNQMETKYSSLMKGNSFAAFFNLPELLRQIPEDNLDSAEGKAFNEFVKPELESFDMMAGTIRNSEIKGKSSLKFKTKSKNALVIWLNMTKKMAEAQKAQKKSLSLK